MRKRFLVSYDISDEKRLRLVFKKMKSFGLHIQLSVFECDLSARELELMKLALDRIIDHKHDQVIVADLGPVDGRGKDGISSLGRSHVPAERKAVVI